MANEDVAPVAEDETIETAAQAWSEALVRVATAKAAHEDARSEENKAACALANARLSEAKAWARLDGLRKGGK